MTVPVVEVADVFVHMDQRVVVMFVRVYGEPLAALLLSPWLISQAYPAVPSLEQVFAALLDGLLGVGATLT